MVLIDSLGLNYITKYFFLYFFSMCPMSGDISTQSPNLDKIILRKAEKKFRRRKKILYF